MNILIDTNIILDGIYLEGKKEEKIPAKAKHSLKLFSYIKSENKGKHLFCIQSNTLQEFPKALSDKYVLQDLYEKGIPLIYYFSERRKRSVNFIGTLKEVIDEFYEKFLDTKLIKHVELTNFIKEDYQVLVDLQIDCGLELQDSLLILGAIVGEINLFVTKDSHFIRNKKLREFIRNSINPNLKVLPPEKALKELKEIKKGEIKLGKKND